MLWETINVLVLETSYFGSLGFRKVNFAVWDMLGKQAGDLMWLKRRLVP